MSSTLTNPYEDKLSSLDKGSIEKIQMTSNKAAQVPGHGKDTGVIYGKAAHQLRPEVFACLLLTSWPHRWYRTRPKLDKENLEYKYSTSATNYTITSYEPNMFSVLSSTGQFKYLINRFTTDNDNDIVTNYTS